jgi:DNA-binding transcriptional LysR family regulator
LGKYNLSPALSALEKELGLQLVYRNTRHFQPTEAGLQFYQQCRQPLRDILSASEDLRQNEKNLKGKFIITVAVDMAHTIMPPVVAAFSQAYPKLNIEIRAEDRQVDLVKEGVDLALRVGTLSDSNLKALKISDVTLILVANPTYLASHAKIRTVANLADHRMICFNRKYEKQLTLMKKNGSTAKIKVSSSLIANNPLIARALALQGQGVALLPDVICYEELKSAQLVRVLPELMGAPSPFHYVWPSHIAESPKVRAFIDFSVGDFRKFFTATAVDRGAQ